MPKTLKQQRRGAGKPRYKVKSHRFKADARYRLYDKTELIKGKILDLIHDPARSAPLMYIKWEDGQISYLPAPLGVFVGQEIQAGPQAQIQVGNILPLKNIPDGQIVYNIEVVPGDGGKLVRSSGMGARVVTHTEKGVIVQLPSKQLKLFNNNCRATIGIVAGGGRIEKPFVKAGNKFYKVKAKGGRLWPRVKGTVMNAVDHPFGGGSKRTRKPKTISKRAPPGKKVGSVGAKRTGRKKR